MKNRDYPLAPTPYPGEDMKSKKLEAKPVSAAKPSMNNVKIAESKQYKESVAAREKANKRKANVKNALDYAKVVGGGAAALTAGYYALTKKVGGKEQKDYSGRVTGKTPEKRIWRWEKE
jgi:hypothetical protein